jgi:hypothetical protein
MRSIFLSSLLISLTGAQLEAAVSAVSPTLQPLAQQVLQAAAKAQKAELKSALAALEAQSNKLTVSDELGLQSVYAEAVLKLEAKRSLLIQKTLATPAVIAPAGVAALGLGLGAYGAVAQHRWHNAQKRFNETVAHTKQDYAQRHVTAFTNLQADALLRVIGNDGSVQDLASLRPEDNGYIGLSTRFDKGARDCPWDNDLTLLRKHGLITPSTLHVVSSDQNLKKINFDELDDMRLLFKDSTQKSMIMSEICNSGRRTKIHFMVPRWQYLSHSGIPVKSSLLLEKTNALNDDVAVYLAEGFRMFALNAVLNKDRMTKYPYTDEMKAFVAEAAPHYTVFQVTPPTLRAGDAYLIGLKNKALVLGLLGLTATAGLAALMVQQERMRIDACIKLLQEAQGAKVA